MTNALAATLRGPSRPWDWWAARWDEAAAAARAHGVLPLAGEAALADPACPPAVRARFEEQRRRDAALELVREHELRRLFERLAAAGVRALVVKGADLAYSCYSSPELRPRTDTDLLIEPGHRRRAAGVLRELGYHAVPQSGGDLLMYQEPYRLERDGVPVHVVDLHWRLFNPQRYGAVFEAAELLERAGPRRALGTAAMGLSPADALLVACVHRIAHHFDRERLIWLVDIERLAVRLAPADWDAFAASAAVRRVSAACLRSLEAAVSSFGAQVPDEVRGRLRRQAASEPDDAPFRDATAPHAARIASDLRLVGGWPARARLLRQHLFPPRHYMRDVYAPDSRLPLAILYLKRIVRGSHRWLRRA